MDSTVFTHIAQAWAAAFMLPNVTQSSASRRDRCAYGFQSRAFVTGAHGERFQPIGDLCGVERLSKPPRGGRQHVILQALFFQNRGDNLGEHLRDILSREPV